MMINGQAHGPQKCPAACQLHMRMFRDGEDIHVEPWRAAAFPVLRDLIVDRSPFDRIVAAGGYITAPTGSAPDANLIPLGKEAAAQAMDAAPCMCYSASAASCPPPATDSFNHAQTNQHQPTHQHQTQR